MTDAPSLRAFVLDRARRFAAAGIQPDEARLDAELLTRVLLGWDRATFIVNEGARVPPGFEQAYARLCERRERREPMAYILGRCEFWGLELEATPAVLIPRPETEQIVEEALARFAGTGGPDRILDIGTGSGCLAVALAREFPRARVVATDVSRAALDVAARNARRHDVETRVAFVRGSLFAPVEGRFDLMVSNPPYVPDGDRAALQPETRDHEPALALFAGPDGLEVIRPMMARARPHLRPGGWLLFEFGFGQADAVGALIEATGPWDDVALVPDLQGIPRTAVVRHPLSSTDEVS